MLPPLHQKVAAQRIKLQIALMEEYEKFGLYHQRNTVWKGTVGSFMTMQNK